MQNNPRFKFDRRRFLKGTGTILIGMPFMEYSSAFAAELPAGVPERFFTFYFGLGVPKELQEVGYTHALSPLAEFADKINMLRGLDMYCGNAGRNNHFDGSAAVFRGMRHNRAQASIDHVIMNAKYPNGVPTPIDALAAGSFNRGIDHSERYNHSIRANNTPVRAVPYETPRSLFDRVFGSGLGLSSSSSSPFSTARFSTSATDPSLNGSILDSVVSQYNYWRKHGAVSSESRRRLELHLDSLRELERRVQLDEQKNQPTPPPTSTSTPFPTATPANTATPIPPPPPGMTPLPTPTPMPTSTPVPPPTATPVPVAGQCQDPNRPGNDNLGLVSEPVARARRDVTMDPEEWADRWRLLTDIYIAGVRCDKFRFGNAMFQSGGERIILKGNYRFLDGSTHSFNDRDTSHEYWHRYRPEREVSDTLSKHHEMVDHTRYIFDQVVYFMRQMDDPRFPDANGKTIFENSGLIISTELGNGAKHDLDSIFNVVNSVGGRFNTGLIMDVKGQGSDREVVDLYNTILRAVGINDRTMGDLDFFQGLIPGLIK